MLRAPALRTPAGLLLRRSLSRPFRRGSAPLRQQRGSVRENALLDQQPLASLAVAQTRMPRRTAQALHPRPARGTTRTLEPAAQRGMDDCMKAKGQTKEGNSESRVRENRLHGLMRGRRRRRIAKFNASLRTRLSATTALPRSGQATLEPMRSVLFCSTPSSPHFRHASRHVSFVLRRPDSNNRNAS